MPMSMNEPVPRILVTDGLIDGGEMSKSKGNIVDPEILIDRYGIDKLKYFLLRVYFWSKTGYTNRNHVTASTTTSLMTPRPPILRTVSMIEKYCGGVVPEATTEDDFDRDLIATALGCAAKVEAHMDEFCFNNALEEIWIVISRANKYIDERCLGFLQRTRVRKSNLIQCAGNLAEVLQE